MISPLLTPFVYILNFPVSLFVFHTGQVLFSVLTALLLSPTLVQLQFSFSFITPPNPSIDKHNHPPHNNRPPFFLNPILSHGSPVSSPLDGVPDTNEFFFEIYRLFQVDPISSRILPNIRFIVVLEKMRRSPPSFSHLISES